MTTRGRISPSTRQSPSKEVLDGNRIAVRREHEVDRIPLGIDGSVQVGPAPRDSNVRLIHSPRAVWMPKFAPDALVQLPAIPEDPAGNGGVIYAEISLGHHLLQVAVTERIA